MTLSKAEQRAIVAADRARREQREMENLAIACGIAYPGFNEEKTPRHAMLVSSDARAMGATTATTCRASQSSWEVPGRPGTLRGRVRGFAKGSSEPDTVTVIKDGKTEIRTVASFRKDREAVKVSKAREVRQTREGETARIGVTHILTGE